MSGILLPGQQPAPKDESGSGLVLPSGYGNRKREETVEGPPVPVEEIAAQAFAADELSGEDAEDAVATQPRQPGAARGQLDLDSLLFPPQAAQVQCPNCGNRFVVPVFQIADLGANPELKQALMSGQLNAAYCPQCGTGGQLSVPLMVHYPEKQFLGVVIPPEARMNAAQSQKMIGDLTQMLMRKLPPEDRKGYMLQPRQFVDWESFLEQMWEFEGVSPQAVRRQRAQSELAQSLLGLADDPAALAIALGRSGDLVDRQFFAIIDQIMLMLMRQPGPELQKLAELRAQLLKITPAGRELAVLQERSLALRQAVTPQTTHNELIDLLLAEWQQPEGRQVALSAVTLVNQAFDYDFLLAISERLEQAQDDEQRAALEEIRSTILRVRDQMEQSNQARVQEVQTVLQEVLSAEDLPQALRDRREVLDETFFSFLAANIDRAEKNNSMGAAKRLTEVYETALDIYAEGLPREERFMNDLITRGRDRNRLKSLLDENRDLITPAFLQTLRDLESQSREGGDTEMADLFKSIRAAASLKM